MESLRGKKPINLAINFLKTVLKDGITRIPTPEFAVAIDNASMSTGNLPRQSWIRCDKVFGNIYKLRSQLNGNQEGI